MRGGRLAHNPAAVSVAPSLANHPFAAAAPVPVCDRAAIAFQPQLRHNNTLPTCTVAGLINAALAAEILNTGGGLVISPDVELPFYAALAGCASTIDAIAGTPGLNVLDVLHQQSVQGFDIGTGTPLTADFGTLPLNRPVIANSIARLGAAYVGIDLYERDMDTPADDPWDDDGSDRGRLITGHLIVLWDYLGLGDTDTGRAATWGTLRRFTWRWLARRQQEAYGMLFPVTQRADGTNWEGIDLVLLRDDIAAWIV